MNRDDYQKVKEIFQTALEIPPPDLAAYLDEKCADNPVLRREVERLLGAFDSDYLERPAVENIAEAIVGNSNLSDGQIFSHYKIIRKIGRGGMGEVFLAEDIRLKRQIALKILPPAISQDEIYLRRFEQEAHAVSALNHPNILTIHEFGAENGTSFIAAEFVEGKTLRELLSGGERLSLTDTFEIARQVATALSSAHNAGIVHRDIKPENVMIRTDGLVKVLDFGLAKLIVINDEIATAIETGQINTTHGMIMGTAAYMSPEQTRGKTADARSDIFSFGIVFYEMLTGRRPFEGATGLESAISILKDEPAPVEHLRPEVTAEIEQIVNKTLRKDRGERYQTAKDLLADLNAAKRDFEFHHRSKHISVPNRDDQMTRESPATITDENQLMVKGGIISPRPKNGNFIYLSLAVLLLAGIGFGVFKYIDNRPAESSQDSVRVTRLTDSGNVGEPVAISPDGKWLVFTIRDENKESIWLKQVAVPDSNTQIVPPSAVHYRNFTISPDGNFLYFSIENGPPSKCTLYSMPLLGGNARKLLDGINGGASFSPDGRQITYGVEDLDNDESVLMVANADGTEPRELVRLKGNDEIGSSRGRWSPDGQSIAVFVGTNNPKTQELATVSVATGEISRLKTHKLSEFGLWEWLPDGSGFIVFARENTTQSKHFWRLSLPSGEAQKITNDTRVYASMSLASDGNTLVTVQFGGTSEIWVAPVGEAAKAAKITSGGEQQWTPDGKLVYTRGLGDRQDIYIIDANGGNPTRLTSDNPNHSPVVSPDGRYVVYVSSQTGTPFIWRMDIDGRNPKQLTTEFSFNPSISPNGKDVIYELGSDTSKIWKVGIDGGVPVQLTENEARNPVFSPDGNFFLCNWWENSNTASSYAIISSDGGKPVRTFPVNDRSDLRWTLDGRSFVYLKKKEGAENIWSEPVTGGTPKQLTNFTSMGMGWFEFSRDGKRIAVNRRTGTSDVVLITGFRK